MPNDEDYERLLPDFKNPNATIFIRNTDDRKYVWVNSEFLRDHGWSMDQVAGKTQIDLFGAENAKSWELSDGLTVATGTPTTTVETYHDPHTNTYRLYGLTKFIATDHENKDYLCGIGVEIKGGGRNVYERRLKDLTNKVLEQLRDVALPPV